MAQRTNEDLSRIVVDESYPHPVAKAWRALTMPDIMAHWLMPNDFQPVVGRQFTMQGTAYEKTNFSGTDKCAVLALEPENTLRISWQDAAPGSTLRSTVTWTLEAEGKGTRVFLEQAGDNPEDPLHQMARNIISGGWTRGILPKLSDVLAADL